MGIIKCVNTECRDFSRSEVNNCSRPLTLIQECPEADVRKAGDQMSEGSRRRPEAMAGQGGQENKDWALYMKELRSNECACGATKKRGYVFCYKCFKSLPQEMQVDLYKKLGEGYEDAREEAGRYLEENIW